MMRLAAEIWAHAYMARLRGMGIPAYVIAHGDNRSGAILVKLSTLDGRAKSFQRMADPAGGGSRWEVLAEGDESDVDLSIQRQLGFDPDLWVIEVEDRLGRHLLDAEGLE